MTWKKLRFGSPMQSVFQSLLEQTSPGSYFQSQIKDTDPPLVFNKNNNISQTFSKKYVGVILDFKLTFEGHLNNC